MNLMGFICDCDRCWKKEDQESREPLSLKCLSTRKIKRSELNDDDLYIYIMLL